MYTVHYLVYSSIIAEVFNFFFFIPFIHKMCKLKAGGTNVGSEAELKGGGVWNEERWYPSHRANSRVLPESQVRLLFQDSVEHTRLKSWRNSNKHPLEAFIWVVKCPL